VELLKSDEDIERAELYRFFAGLFMQEPSDETIMQAKDMFQLEFDDTFQEIRIEYNHLFSIPNGHLIPCESLYNYPVGEKQKLWGAAAERVEAFYSSAGLMIDVETNLMPDHISAEFLFMSYLIDNRLNRLQSRFLKEHIGVWVPGYCDMLKDHASTGFYKEIADVLKEFVLFEIEGFESGEYIEE
jgi:TorA maturation chaperone TorD